MTARSALSLLACAVLGAALTLGLLARFASADGPHEGVRQAPPVVIAAADVAETAPTDAGDVAPSAAPAPAAAHVDPEDPVGLIRAAYNAITGDRSWTLAAGALLSLLVLGVRRTPWLPRWFKTDRGGVALVLGTALATGVSHALLAGASVNLLLVESIVGVAIAAIGGYAGLRRLIWPPDKVA